jgi:hypothetical protein
MPKFDPDHEELILKALEIIYENDGTPMTVVAKEIGCDYQACDEPGYVREQTSAYLRHIVSHLTRTTVYIRGNLSVSSSSSSSFLSSLA